MTNFCYDNILQTIANYKEQIYIIQQQIAKLEATIYNSNVVLDNLTVNGDSTLIGNVSIGTSNLGGGKGVKPQSGNLTLNGLVLASDGAVLIDPGNQTCSFSKVGGNNLQIKSTSDSANAIIKPVGDNLTISYLAPNGTITYNTLQTQRSENFQIKQDFNATTTTLQNHNHSHTTGGDHGHTGIVEGNLNHNHRTDQNHNTVHLTGLNHNDIHTTGGDHGHTGIVNGNLNHNHRTDQNHNSIHKTGGNHGHTGIVNGSRTINEYIGNGANHTQRVIGNQNHVQTITGSDSHLKIAPTITVGVTGTNYNETFGTQSAATFNQFYNLGNQIFKTTVVNINGQNYFIPVLQP